MRNYGYRGDLKITTWLSAFNALRQFILQEDNSKEKKVIFFDELSWMDTSGKKFLPALENFWNDFLSTRDDIVFIVSASSTSWILNKVLHNKGGLYNRLSYQIHLSQLSLGECEELLKSLGMDLDRMMILEFYMIFGGVPYYWTLIQKNLTLEQNIDYLLFSPVAPLKDEFIYLYSSIFAKPTVYINIIKALYSKKSGMTRDELMAKLKVKTGGSLSSQLTELEACGFLRKYESYQNKKISIYQLIDNFTIFYLTFKERSITDSSYFSHFLNKPKLNTWKGLAFERVCLEHVYQIKNKLGIIGVISNEFSFLCKENKEKGIYGSQIDLFIDREDRIINVCEMKYSTVPYEMTEEDDMKMRLKMADFEKISKTNKVLFPVIVSPFGLKENKYSMSYPYVITLKNLFFVNDD